MAERSTSITLPQNRPDVEPAAQTDVKPATADGKPQDQITSKNDSTEDKAKSLNTAQDIPVKDDASILTNTTSSIKYSKRDESSYRKMIQQIHQAAQQETHKGPISDDETELLKLNKLVSQMAHLLAADGVVGVSSPRRLRVMLTTLQGRETTARALAYINGPDKPSVKAALYQAKRDRRDKNKRRFSYGDRKGKENLDKAVTGNISDSRKPGSDETGTTATTIESGAAATDNAITTTDEGVNAMLEKARDSVEQETKAAGNGSVKSGKGRFRRPWAWKHRYGRNKRDGKDQKKDKSTQHGEKDGSAATITPSTMTTSKAEKTGDMAVEKKSSEGREGNGDVEKLTPAVAAAA